MSAVEVDDVEPHRHAWDHEAFTAAQAEARHCRHCPAIEVRQLGTSLPWTRVDGAHLQRRRTFTKYRFDADGNELRSATYPAGKVDSHVKALLRSGGCAELEIHLVDGTSIVWREEKTEETHG